MLALLSPSEEIDFRPPRGGADRAPLPHSMPELPEAAGRLFAQMRSLGEEDRRRLGEEAERLGRVAGAVPPEADEGRPQERAKEVLLAFAGTTYRGLDAESLDRDDLIHAQDRLRIVSGLYGLYRPLDRVPEHTLDLDARLRQRRDEDLQDYWAAVIGPGLDGAVSGHRAPVIVNLAHDDVFEMARRQTAMGSRVINVVFKQEQGGGVMDVRQMDEEARGIMARWMIVNRAEDPDDLKTFGEAGYHFNKDQSDADTWAFTRPLPARHQ